MPKNILQDVIKIKNNKKIEVNQKKIFTSDALKNVATHSSLGEGKQKEKKSYNSLWLVAVISIVFLFFSLSYFFSSAIVTINPKMKDFTLNQNVVATPKANDSTGLSYDIIVLSGEEQKEVPGGEERDWKVPATGKILFYNAFNFSNQIIPANTKLEGSNGKIYETKNEVIIPGIAKDRIPGKIEVDIFAEKIGEEYNSKALDFKVLIFKGTSKYSKIFARSVGDIVGGFNGKSNQLSDVDKENDVQQLKDLLYKKLFNKAKNQIPNDFILLNNATFLNIDEQDIVPSKNLGFYTVDIKGTFSGILFDKNQLTKEVINDIFPSNNLGDGTIDSLSENSATPSVTSKDVYLSNIENLSISSFDQNLITLADMKNITFNLSGTVKVVWNIDVSKIAEDLLGKSKKDFNKILLQYPNINSADLVIKPVWKNSFPDKLDKIKVIVNNSK